MSCIFRHVTGHIHYETVFKLPLYLLKDAWPEIYALTFAQVTGGFYVICIPCHLRMHENLPGVEPQQTLPWMRQKVRICERSLNRANLGIQCLHNFWCRFGWKLIFSQTLFSDCLSLSLLLIATNSHTGLITSVIVLIPACFKNIITKPFCYQI